MKVTAGILLVVLMSVWAGIIIGVSLVATPAKFQAPSLTVPVGLDVGRYTFRLLMAIELCLLVAAIVIASVAQPHWVTVVAIALVVAMMLLQRYWLLPILDGRVTQILAGRILPSSIHHRVYAVMEALKAALLIAGAVLEYRLQLLPGLR